MCDIVRAAAAELLQDLHGRLLQVDRQVLHLLCAAKHQLVSRVWVTKRQGEGGRGFSIVS